MEILYAHRALKISGRDRGGKYLVVSDLHVGFEEKFRGAGISIESNVNSMAEELHSLIEENKITNLVVIGDVKSTVDRISGAEWENVPKLFSKIPHDCSITIVPGNHDGGLNHLVPDRVEIADLNGIVVDGNLLMHGHTRPLAKFSSCKRLIMGHLHPIYQERGNPLSGQALWVFLKIRRKKVFEEVLEEANRYEPLLEVAIMPSFNRDLTVAGYARDAARKERRTAPILRALEDAEEALIMTLNGEIIGDVSTLPKIL